MPQMEIIEEIQTSIFASLFSGTPLKKILDILLVTLERHNPKMICSILLLDEDGKHLLSTAAPSLPDFYVDAINGSEIGFGIGSCGTAAYTGENVIVEDIQNHPYWKNYKDLAGRAGLASCWSEPIKDEDDRVLGTFAIYQKNTASPTQQEAYLIKKVAKIVAVTIKYFNSIDELKASEQKYKLMFEDNPQPMYIFDLETYEFLEVNNAIVELYGYSREEFLKMKIFDIRPKEDEPVLRDFLKTRIHKKNGLLEAGNWKHLKKNGELVYVQISFQPITYNKRKAGYVLISDISEVKKAKIKLANSERRLFTILETIPDCVKLMDKNRELLDINPAGLALFEVESKEELMGLPIVNFVEKPFQKPFLQLVNKVFEGKSGNLEFKITGRKGTSRWIEMRTTPLKLGDDSIYMLSVLRDLTIEKENQLILKEQNEELKKSNAELDRFVYSTSHDLRSPLSSMLGLVKIIEVETKEAHTYDHVRMIKNRIDRLDHLIKDILSYSFNKRMEIIPTFIDFNKVVFKTIANLEYIETSKKIKFEVKIENQRPFHSDLHRIYTILENLIGNSIKYYNPQQNAPFVKIGVTVSEENAKITVEDNGIGIEEDLLPKIFDMFYRISNNQEGSGIGLYLVNETVKNIGGKISVSSESGAGTKFTVVLKNYSDGFTN